MESISEANEESALCYSVTIEKWMCVISNVEQVACQKVHVSVGK